MIPSTHSLAFFHRVVVVKLLPPFHPLGLNRWTTRPPVGYSLSDLPIGKYRLIRFQGRGARPVKLEHLAARQVKKLGAVHVGVLFDG